MRSKPWALQRRHQSLIVNFRFKNVYTNEYYRQYSTESKYPFIPPSHIGNQPSKWQEKEYHRRVSPIVRKGGLSNEYHNKPINVPKTRSPIKVNVHARILNSLKAFHEPIIQNNTDAMAKYINQSQLIIFPYFLIIFLLGSDKHTHSTKHHHYNSYINSRKPRI